MKVHDTIRVDISTNKIMDSIKFESGNICMVTGGANTGRVGIIMNRERHQGSFDIVHVKVQILFSFTLSFAYKGLAKPASILVFFYHTRCFFKRWFDF